MSTIKNDFERQLYESFELVAKNRNDDVLNNIITYAFYTGRLNTALCCSECVSKNTESTECIVSILNNFKESIQSLPKISSYTQEQYEEDNGVFFNATVIRDFLNVYLTRKELIPKYKECKNRIMDNPSSTDYFVSGEIARVQNKYEQACEEYEKAIGLNPNMAIFYARYVECAFELNERNIGKFPYSPIKLVIYGRRALDLNKSSYSYLCLVKALTQLEQLTLDFNLEQSIYELSTRGYLQDSSSIYRRGLKTFLIKAYDSLTGSSEFSEDKLEKAYTKEWPTGDAFHDYNELGEVLPQRVEHNLEIYKGLIPIGKVEVTKEKKGSVSAWVIVFIIVVLLGIVIAFKLY